MARTLFLILFGILIGVIGTSMSGATGPGEKSQIRFASDERWLQAIPTPPPPPIRRPSPQKPPQIPEEPSADVPPPTGHSIGTCWFDPIAEDLQTGCRATFTLCPQNTNCDQWLWVTCRGEYVYIGPHTPSFLSSILGIFGFPFGPFADLPAIELYFTEGNTTTGAFSLLSFRGRNRFGACLLIADSGQSYKPQPPSPPPH